MKLLLHYTSKGRCDWADTAAEDYTKRLRRYAPFEEQKHKPEAGQNRDQAQLKEAQRIVNKLGPRDRLIVLDERGTSLSSHGLANLIEESALVATNRLVFAIGGPYGHHVSMRTKATKCIKLSEMVLNHQVARVLLLEQLYRAWTILKNEPYHHA